MKSDSDDIFDNNILGIYHYILIGISQQSESNTFWVVLQAGGDACYPEGLSTEDCILSRKKSA